MSCFTTRWEIVQIVTYCINPTLDPLRNLTLKVREAHSRIHGIIQRGWKLLLDI